MGHAQREEEGWRRNQSRGEAKREGETEDRKYEIISKQEKRGSQTDLQVCCESKIFGIMRGEKGGGKRK